MTQLKIHQKGLVSVVLHLKEVIMKINLAVKKWLSAFLIGVMVLGAMSVSGCASIPGDSSSSEHPMFRSPE